MAVGRYVVTEANGTTVVSDPFMWDPDKAPNWKHPLVEAVPSRRMLPETPTRRTVPGPIPVTDQNRATLLSRAEQALTANATFLAIGSPTNAQVLQQVQRLTRECSAIIRLLVLDRLDDISDT